MSATFSGDTLNITFVDDTWKTAFPSFYTVTDGTTPFYSANTWVYDNKNVLRSGSISDNGTSETTINLNLVKDGSVEFNYIVSSENNYDKLHVLLDNTEIVTASGTSTTTFTVVNKSLTAGSHTLIFRYTKDGSGSSGSDAGAIGYIKLTGLATMYYLLSDESGKVYNYNDSGVTEITGVTIADLLKKDTFIANGVQNKLPTSEQILTLTKPKLHRYCNVNVGNMSATITGVPAEQQVVYSQNIDMTDSTIKGIDSVAITSDDDTLFAISFDNGKTWLNYIDNAWVMLSTDVSGQTKTDIEEISTTAWAEKATTGMIKFRWVLATKTNYVTRIQVNFLN